MDYATIVKKINRNKGRGLVGDERGSFHQIFFKKIVSLLFILLSNGNLWHDPMPKNSGRWCCLWGKLQNLSKNKRLEEFHLHRFQRGIYKKKCCLSTSLNSTACDNLLAGWFIIYFNNINCIEFDNVM